MQLLAYNRYTKSIVNMYVFKFKIFLSVILIEKRFNDDDKVISF